MPLRLFDYISSEDEMSPWFAFTDEVVYLHKLLYNHPYYEQFRVSSVEDTEVIHSRTLRFCVSFL